MGGSVWEVVGGKDSGGITVRTAKELKSPESTDGRLSHGALVAELELDGERLRFTRLTGTGPNDGWVSLSFKNRPLLVRSGDIGSKVAEDAAALELAKANGGIMQPKPGCYRLWLLPQGSRGDVQPMLALGVVARKKGWAVHLFSGPENKDFVESYGLRFTACGPDLAPMCQTTGKEQPDEEMLEEYKKDPGAMGANAVGDLYNPEVRAKISETLLAELERAKQEDSLPHALFFHGLAGSSPFWVWHRYGIPICQVDYTQQCMSSDEDLMGWAENFVQEQSKEIEEMYGENIVENWSKEAIATWAKNNILSCTSKLLANLFFDADELTVESQVVLAVVQSRFKGPMIMDPASQMVDLSYFGGQETLRGLQDFIDAGPKPAYVGWGSMPMTAGVLAKVVLNLKMNKLRGILLGGWAGLTRESLEEWITSTMPDDPFGLIEYARQNTHFTAVAPHEWLFQRCAFTVHHGGAGTTQAALRAGVPTIIMPFSFDQFMYADWVTKLGCGQQLSLKDNMDKMMDPMFSKAFRKAATDKDMIAKAKWVGEEIRKEVGTTNVLAHIQECIEKKARGETAGQFGA